MSALIFILPMPTDSVTVFVALFRCGQKTRKLERFLPYTKRIFTKPTIYRTFIFTIEKITISQNRTKAEIISILFEINDCKTPYNFMLLKKNL